MKQKYKNQTGYVALISVIIVSALLLVISASVTLTAFLSRFNTADMEYKKRSSALAEACLDAALLQLAKNPNDTAIGTVSVGSDSCAVYNIRLNTPTAGQTTIQTKAIFGQAVTNLQIVVNGADLSILSWQELPAL